jgi:hypothetical protein
MSSSLSPISKVNLRNGENGGDVGMTTVDIERHGLLNNDNNNNNDDNDNTNNTTASTTGSSGGRKKSGHSRKASTEMSLTGPSYLDTPCIVMAVCFITFLFLVAFFHTHTVVTITYSHAIGTNQTHNGTAVLKPPTSVRACTPGLNVDLATCECLAGYYRITETDVDCVGTHVPTARLSFICLFAIHTHIHLFMHGNDECIVSYITVCKPGRNVEPNTCKCVIGYHRINKDDTDCVGMPYDIT